MKLPASQILVKDAQLTVVTLQAADVNVTRLIDETKQKQAEVLKLKRSINQTVYNFFYLTIKKRLKRAMMGSNHLSCFSL